MAQLVERLVTSFNPTERIWEDRKNGTKAFIVRGKLQSIDCPNKNNRIYPRSVWENAITKETSPFVQRLNKDGGVVGQLEHPESGVSRLSVSETSHLMKKVYIVENDIMGEIIVLDTPAGKVLQELFLNGYNPGISSRGQGDVRIEEGREVVEDNYILETWDFVYDPSVEDARPKMIESAKQEPKMDELSGLRTVGAAKEKLTQLSRLVESVKDIRGCLKLNEEVRMALGSIVPLSSNLTSPVAKEAMELSGRFDTLSGTINEKLAKIAEDSNPDTTGAGKGVEAAKPATPFLRKNTLPKDYKSVPEKSYRVTPNGKTSQRSEAGFIKPSKSPFITKPTFGKAQGDLMPERRITSSMTNRIAERIAARRRERRLAIAESRMGRNFRPTDRLTRISEARREILRARLRKLAERRRRLSRSGRLTLSERSRSIIYSLGDRRIAEGRRISRSTRPTSRFSEDRRKEIIQSILERRRAKKSGKFGAFGKGKGAVEDKLTAKPAPKIKDDDVKDKQTTVDAKLESRKIRAFVTSLAAKHEAIDRVKDKLLRVESFRKVRLMANFILENSGKSPKENLSKTENTPLIKDKITESVGRQQSSNNSKPVAVVPDMLQ